MQKKCQLLLEDIYFDSKATYSGLQIHFQILLCSAPNFRSLQYKQAPHTHTCARTASGLATRGLSPKITNNSNKSYSHFRTFRLCPFPSTILHFSYIAPSVYSSFGNIPGMHLLEYCVALPVNFLSSRQTQLVLLVRISA